MKNASLLLLVGPEADVPGLKSVLQRAVEMQRHLSFLVLGTTPRPPMFAYGMEFYAGPAISEAWQEDIEAATAGLTSTAKAIEALLNTCGASGDVAILRCEAAVLGPLVARRAATCDAVLVSDDLREDAALFHDAVHSALFMSPAPVILNGVRASDGLSAARVFIAWDGDLPAARAVHAALAILKKAATVTIGVFDPVRAKVGDNPGSDAARWLSHHGCTVDVQQFPSGGEEIGTCILERAIQAGADLVVTGAYGHSRMRQAVFGGTTRTLIDQTTAMILLVH